MGKGYPYLYLSYCYMEDTYLFPHGKCNYNYLYVLSKFIKEGITGKGYKATTS